MTDALIERLIQHTQQRQYQALVDIWTQASAALKGNELATRLVAAAYAQQGNLRAAESLISSLLGARVCDGATLALAGRIAFDLGEYSASLARLERAVALNRDNELWWIWFADAAVKAHEPARALVGAEVHTLRRNRNPDLAIAYATVLVHAGRTDDALLEFERILAHWPHHATAGPGYAEFVMREYPLEALDLLDRTPWRPLGDDLSPARVRASLWLPPLYASEADAATWRNRLLIEIRDLTVRATRSTLGGDARAQCLATTPFFAAYHDADVTAIQFAWGDFVEAVVAPLRTELGLINRPRTLPPQKIGIVSNRLTNSSAGRFFNAWVSELKSAGYDVRLYALGGTDHVTEALGRMALLRKFPEDDVTAWRPLTQALVTDANDVLLFPEPQGSQLTVLVAALRLAPIQCAGFGNPLTTGLRSMDFFLTPDAAEVEAPQASYREQVVRLRGLGTSIEAAPRANALSREAFGFRDDERIYLVSQAMSKWTPRFIECLCSILEKDASGRIAYFGFGSTVSVRAFQLSLRKALAAHGIDFASRTVFISGLEREDYLALHQAVDVGLDTFGFGGGSSTFDALSVGLPVISCEGGFLRGRQTAGMLRLAGFANCIVDNTDDFVSLAIATATERRAGRYVSLINPTTGTTLPSRSGCFDNLSVFLRSTFG